MNAPLSLMLPDAQSTPDTRGIALQHVGVKAILYVVRIALEASDDAPAASVATIDMFVGLPAEVKGAHMSRFLEVLQAHDARLSFKSLHGLMAAMLHRLVASDGYISLRMPYFRMKAAPVSRVQSLLDYDVAFEAVQQSGAFTLTQTVVVPVTSLCPCSKDISAYGARNQRSHVTISVTLRAPLAVDALIDVAEESASCEVYGLLKRPYENMSRTRSSTTQSSSKTWYATLPCNSMGWKQSRTTGPRAKILNPSITIPRMPVWNGIGSTRTDTSGASPFVMGYCDRPA